jgi:putative membrane protein
VPTDDAGPVVDYRMSLAAERTYLAYVRTALALLAAGIAVVGALPDIGHLGIRRVMGVLLVTAGLTLAVAARPRWRRLESAMRRGAELPASRIELVPAIAVGLAGVLGLVLVVLA